MPIAAAELAQIVWAETSSLGPSRTDGKGDVNDFRRLLAQLAASLNGEGFPNRAPLPAANDSLNGATAKQIAALADAALATRPPQRRLIIWDATDDLSGLDRTTAPPAPWPNVALGETQMELATILPNRRRIVAMSRPAAADGDGPPLVNILTGAGLPAPVRFTPDPIPTLRDASRITIAALIFGFLLFGAGGLMSALSGLSMAGAHNGLLATDPVYLHGLMKEVARICLSDDANYPASQARAKAPCKDILTPATQTVKSSDLAKALANPNYDLDAQLDPSAGVLTAMTNGASACATGQAGAGAGCLTYWRAAIIADQAATGRAAYFSLLYSISLGISGINPSAGSTSIVAAYVVSLLGVVIVLGALGIATKQSVAGVWIDQRNRVSLARAQVTVWTVVLLSGYLIFALFNVGFAAELKQTGDWITYTPFPTMPWSWWAALGISTTSPMLSALALNTKDRPDDTADFDVAGADADLTKRGGAFLGANSSGLAKHDDAAQASIVDLFMGEENANSDIVDISRLQNVLITISLASAVFWTLVEFASNIPMTDMIVGGKPVIDSMPSLGKTFVSLLFVSHAAYLVAKSHDKPATGRAAAQGAQR